MKKLSFAFDAIVLVLLFNSCSAIEGIFKTDFWPVFLLMSLVVVVIIFLLYSMFKNKKATNV
jgi:uncharacterized membrane protein YcaP (DUF421 family)